MALPWRAALQTFDEPIDERQAAEIWREATRNYDEEGCHDIHRGTLSDADIVELSYVSRLHYLSYAMPHACQLLLWNFDRPLAEFDRVIESRSSDEMLQDWASMRDIRRDVLRTVPVPGMWRGYWIRTPVRLFDARGTPVYTVPPVNQPNALNEFEVYGNVTVNVLKHHNTCVITFRGTTDHFCGVPQYGKGYERTQVLAIPDYNLSTRQRCPGGSDSVPLFFENYVRQVDDAWPHIMQCLEWLDWHKSDRVIVTGSSMGAGLALTFAFMVHSLRADLWQKLHVRTLATPLCCNGVASAQMAAWMNESEQVNKYMDMVNSDDLLNVKYLLGETEGVQDSIKRGRNRLMGWMLQNNKKVDDVSMLSRMMRLIETYPDALASVFASGAIANSQVWRVPADPRHSTRVGYSNDVRTTESLRVIMCQRAIRIDREYLGKSHTTFLGLHSLPIWSSARMIEEWMHDFYHRKGLQRGNELYITGYCPNDAEKVTREIDHYYLTARKKAQHVGQPANRVSK